MAENKPNKITQALRLNGAWDVMSPNQRRMVTVAGGVACVVTLLALIPDGREGGSVRANNDVKRSILTADNTRNIGIDSLNAKVKTVESENTALKKTIERMESELNELQRRRGNDPDMQRQVAQLQSSVKNLNDQAKTLGWQVDDIKDGYFVVPGTERGESSPPIPVASTQSNAPVAVAPQPAVVRPVQTATVDDQLAEDPNAIFAMTPPPALVPKAGATRQGDARGASETLQIFTDESVAQTLPEEEAPSITHYLPAGSILSGVLMNGLDAPTGRGARKDPYPVLVRIQLDAVLPNLRTSDVKECFATLSGYGELSTERAMLRGEKFSCVTDADEVIEMDFPSYAVGEDGKAGVKGALVTRSGALLAKTAMAGFAAGVAEAFSSTPVPIVATGTPGNDKAYQNNFSSDTAKYGAAQGASRALERLSDYYMDLADEIFPVVEVGVGRQIDIVLTQGFKLEVKDLAAKKSNSKGARS